MIVGRILVLSKLVRSGVKTSAVLQELRYQVLRLAVCRKLKLTKSELEEYLSHEVIVSLITSPVGMISALFAGLAKLSTKSVKNLLPRKNNRRLNTYSC
jgi:hypothetical protein